MRKLEVNTLKTVRESDDLVKVLSNQTGEMESLKAKIIRIIEEAKKIDKRKKIDDLRTFIDGYTNEKYHTNPGKLSLDNLKTTTETNYQRRIFSSEKTKLNEKDEVVWVDMELPVVFSKRGRRKCVDLIGELNNSTSVLCELKLASEKNHSDSPIYAALELLIYYYLIQENSKELDKENVFHTEKRLKDFKWEYFNHASVFIIGANDAYWTHWKKRYEKQRNEIESWQSSLPIKIHFFCSGNFNLENLKEAQSAWTEVYL